jgi:Mg2+ and Co2+ transporter CorA
VDKYFDFVQQEAKAIFYEICAVEKDLEMESKSDRRSLANRLNACSQKIRLSNFERRTPFSIEAIQWLKEILKNPRYDFYAHNVFAKLAEDQDAHPEQLRTRITEVHAQIADRAARQQQAREEKIRDLGIYIATESRRDSRTMRGIAWITMAFLPATFVTSFFGMNFFIGVPGYPPFDATSRSVWIYFVVALPITAVVLSIFWWWDRKQQRLVDEDLGKKPGLVARQKTWEK